MAAPNNKARSDAFQEDAQRLLEERGIDVTQQVALRPLAKELAAREGCHYDTAKRHLARAVRLARGQLAQAPQWGGRREGAGRPHESEEETS